jgi:hypothetical protein
MIKEKATRLTPLFEHDDDDDEEITISSSTILILHVIPEFSEDFIFNLEVAYSANS